MPSAKTLLLASLLMATGAESRAAPAQPKWCEDALAYSAANEGVSLLVLKNGRTICASTDIATPYELYSGTKSLVGLMAAAAVQDKLLKLDERASDTLTEWKSEPQKANITIRQLLSMTSGQDGNRQRFLSYADSVNAPLTAAPGTRFQYGPTPLQIVGEIMHRKLLAANRDGNPRHYIQTRILTPIGVTVPKWRNGPDGNPLMPEGLSLGAAQWARIGEFVRAGGRHGGRRLVDSAALAELFKGSAVNPAYGLTWWLPRASTAGGPTNDNTDIALRANEFPHDLVVAGGAGKQRMYVIPSRGLTIVRQARFDATAARAEHRTPSNWSDAHFISLIVPPPSKASGTRKGAAGGSVTR